MRLVLGTVMAVVLAAVLWADSLSPYAPGVLAVCLLAAAAGSWEYMTLAEKRGVHPPRLWVVLGAVLLVLGHWADTVRLLTTGPLGLSWALAMLVLWAVAAMALAAFRFHEDARAVETLATALLSVVYIGMLGFVVRLRLVMDDPGTVGCGSMAVVLLLAVVKGGDIGAYFVGRSLGRRPLAPILSPKKTIEGAVGGLVVSAAAAALLCWLWQPGGRPLCGLPGALLFGIVVGAAGQVGDLVESLAKRDTGVKDSGRTLLAFGGTLDMLDSVLLAAPVACATLWAVVSWGM